MNRTLWTALALACTAALVASALALVTARYRARGLFAELEVTQQQARSLDAEGNRLRIELGRAAQPASIEAAARAVGMRPVDPDRTVFLARAPSAAAGAAP